MAKLLDREKTLDFVKEYADHAPIDDESRWAIRALGLGMCEIPTVDAEPVRQWISVKDMLPMIDENVLVFAQGKEDGFIVETKIAIAYMTDCTYFGGSPIKVEPRWRCPLQFFLTDYEITHWMPLPKPPKEDDDETD